MSERYGLGRQMLPEAVSPFPHSLIPAFPPYSSSMSGSRQLLSKNAGSGP